MSEDETESTDEFDELDLDTPRRAVLLVYDEESDCVEVDNIHDLPYPLVLGILHVAVKQWEYNPTEEWVEWEDAETDED